MARSSHGTPAARPAPDLRTADEPFQEIIETLPEVFWSAEPGLRKVRYVSPGYERIWGRSCASLYARPRSFVEGIHPDDRERVRTCLGGKPAPFTIEYRVVRPDGSERWVSDRGYPVCDPAGRVTHFIGIAADVTALKAVEGALRESEQQMRLFMEATADSVWQFDLLTGAVDRSVGFSRTFGYAPEEMEPTLAWWEARVHRDDYARVMGVFARALAAGDDACAYEYRFRRKDGTYAVIRDRALLVRDAAGTVVRAVGAMTDISGRRHAEDALRASEIRLRALSRRLVEVRDEEQRRLSGDLHDGIGQNLAALSVNLGIVSRLLPEAADPRLHAYVRESQALLERSITSMRNVISDLRPPTLDEYGLLAGLRWYAARLEARGGLAVAVEGAEPVPRLAPAVERELFRIAQEALTNTLKHARARSARVRLDVARLTVADDGVGFDPADAGMLEQHGHWGLAMMCERAAAVGASMHIESAPGRGTRIIVDLRPSR